MQISQFALARLFLYAFFTGLFLGVLYDLLKTVRELFNPVQKSRATVWRQTVKLPCLRQWKPSDKRQKIGVLIFLGDFLFCIFSGVVLILLFYEWNHGTVRIPAVFCAVGGFLCYRLTLGRLLGYVYDAIAFAIWASFRYLFFFVRLPFYWLFKVTKRLIGIFYNKWKVRRDKKERIQMTRKEWERMQKYACDIIPYHKEKEKHGGNAKKETI